MQAIPEKILAIHGVEMNVAHNGFQEAVVVWGAVGLLLFFFLLFGLFRSTRGRRRRRAVAFVPFFLWALYVSAGQLVTSESALLALVFISVVLIAAGKEEARHGGE